MLFKRLLPLLAALTLAACGGSGSGNDPPPSSTPQPTQQDLADAKAAAVTSSVDPSTQMVTLTWTDTFASATGYTIEQQTGGTTWATVETVQGQSGSKTRLKWAKAIGTTTALRVQAALSGYTVLLKTPSEKDHIDLAVPATAPTLVIDSAEPIAGSVAVSIGNGSTYSSVQYFLDSTAFATSTTGPDYGAVLDVRTLEDSTHTLLARLQTSSDTFLEVSRSLQVVEAFGQVSFFAINDSGATTEVILRIASGFGVQNVALRIDGVVKGTLTIPNQGGTDYVFTFNNSDLGSGQHRYVAQFTDGVGHTTSSAKLATTDNAPLLSFDSGYDGMLAFGTLHVSGTASTDKPGATINVDVKFGSRDVVRLTTSPFSTDIDLTGVTPGDYTLTLTATDSTSRSTLRSFLVTVVASADHLYPRLAQLGSGGKFLAAGPASTAVYSLFGGETHFVSGSTDVILDTEDLQATVDFHIENGHVFAIGLPEGPGAQFHLYHWTPAGDRDDLGVIAVTSGSVPSIQAAHWPWVLVKSFVTPNIHLELFNATNGNRVTPMLTAPAGVNAGSHDFFVSPNDVVMYYAANLTAGSGNAVAIGIYRWDQQTDGVTPIAVDNGLRQASPRTNGTEVTWEYGNVGSNDRPNLELLNIVPDTRQTLTTTLKAYALGAGIVAWAEGTQVLQTIKAFDGNQVVTITQRLDSTLYDAGEGYALYGEEGKLYVANTDGDSQLVFTSIPTNPQIAGKTVYITNGPSKPLYALTLD